MAVDTALIFNIIAKDHTRKTFDRVGLAAKAAFAAAGFGVAMFAKQSIAAYADAEKQQVRLEGAYKRFPKIADVSIGALRDMNEALQDTTRFDADAVAGAQALLAQFNLTGQQIKETTPLLLDYAAATGKDVASAAESLGKAFLGQTRALKEVGINYKTTGDSATDFANITDLLRGKVGGFAEEEGKTAAGQLAILSNKFGDLQEAVGETLLPALTALVDIAKPMLDTFNGLPKPMRAAAVTATAVGIAAFIAVPKIVAFKAAIASWGPAGTTALAGSRKAAKGVAIAAAALTVAAVAIDKVNEASENSVPSAKLLNKALNDLARTGNGVLTSASDETYSFADALNRIADPSVTDRMNDMWASLVGGAGSPELIAGRKYIENIDTALAEMVSSGNAEAAAKAFALMAKDAEAQGRSIDDVRSSLPLYTDALDDVKSASKGTASMVQGVTSKADAQKRAVDALKSSWDLLSGLLDKRAAKRNWIDSMSEISQKIKDAGGKFDESTGKGRDFQDWLDTTVGNLQNYARGFTNPLKQQQVMNDGLDDIRENLRKQGLSPSQVSNIMAGFDKIKGKVVALQQQAQKSTVLNITPRITGKGQIVIGSGAASKFIDVDYRESGGPVKAGRPYVVGERRPELFVPKTDGTILPTVPSGGSGGVHIENVNVIAAPGERLEESVPRAFRRTAFVLGMGAA